MTDHRVEEEKQRLTALLFDCGISDRRMKAMLSVVENIAWMRIKLDDTRDMIKDSTVAIPYDNGGGQTGIRENPLFKGYQSLFGSYLKGMAMVMDCLPAEAENVDQDGPEKPKTVLELVRNKHRKEA